jgi:hypothetical protein
MKTESGENKALKDGKLFTHILFPFVEVGEIS